jgi:novobiocin biosynthesis protein NovU/D-mycarose 3-C-methyltransferase
MMAKDACQAVNECLGCGATDLRLVLDLGTQPLANDLTPADRQDAVELRFPLGIQMCKRCLLVQLTHIVDPDIMFSSYLYVPSTSTTWLQHCEELADFVCSAAELQPGDLVVEIGSNDGALLKSFQKRGQEVLGIDPASNIAEQANASGVPTLNRFFGQETAGEVLTTHRPARAIVSTNVLAHVPDPVGLLRGVRALLSPDGLYVNESPSLLEMVKHSEFDTIYHEHVSYLSLHATENLLHRAGLGLVDAVAQQVHGGTLRIAAAPLSPGLGLSPSARALKDAETHAGVLEMSRLRQFAEQTQGVRNDLRAMVGQFEGDGKRLAAYGATAKGTILLGYCGLTHRNVEYVVDRNPLKQGRVVPGARVPVVSPEHLRAEPPDVLLLLAWNLASEIQQQQSWFTESGGQFLIPVPSPRLI